MKKRTQIYILFLTFVFCTACKGQNKTEQLKENIKSESKEAIPSTVPNSITRNMVQDRKGNIWITSWEGMFRYDGKSFTNITNTVSSARFFSVLEDRKGNLWFGTIGSGVYAYDGIAFQNFTTNEGLVNNEVGCMYEDKAGNIWFGVNGGASRYDGKSFRNYMMNGGSMSEERTGKTFPNLQRPPNEVTSIIEDKTGKYWFGTRGNTFVYDTRLNDEVGQGKAFTVVTREDGIHFTNVRCIIEDKKGNVWLGGNDGLWRYDGNTFTNITQDFVGYIYEDRNGNIWTSSGKGGVQNWVLSRYEAKSLADKKPTVTEINPRVGMLFGILEATDGSIWFGSSGGVYRYDGSTVTDFKFKEIPIIPDISR